MCITILWGMKWNVTPSVWFYRAHMVRKAIEAALSQHHILILEYKAKCCIHVGNQRLKILRISDFLPSKTLWASIKLNSLRLQQFFITLALFELMCSLENPTEDGRQWMDEFSHYHQVITLHFSGVPDQTKCDCSWDKGYNSDSGFVTK